MSCSLAAFKIFYSLILLEQSIPWRVSRNYSMHLVKVSEADLILVVSSRPLSTRAHLALVHVNYAILALSAPSMAMPTIASASFGTSLHMSKALGLRIWRAVNGHSPSPMRWQHPSDMPVSSIESRRYRHISSTTTPSKYTRT